MINNYKGGTEAIRKMAQDPQIICADCENFGHSFCGGYIANPGRLKDSVKCDGLYNQKDVDEFNNEVNILDESKESKVRLKIAQKLGKRKFNERLYGLRPTSRKSSIEKEEERKQKQYEDNNINQMNCNYKTIEDASPFPRNPNYIITEDGGRSPRNPNHKNFPIKSGGSGYPQIGDDWKELETSEDSEEKEFENFYGNQRFKDQQSQNTNNKRSKSDNRSSDRKTYESMNKSFNQKQRTANKNNKKQYYADLKQRRFDKKQLQNNNRKFGNQEQQWQSEYGFNYKKNNKRLKIG